MTYFLDLFSGIGGFSLGAYWAGLRFDGHYFSEVDDYAIRVYQQRFPDAVPLGDIRNIRGSDLPAGDWIIAGGFPCQDISVAGKGAGLAGERSGLFFAAADLIRDIRPRYAVLENVGNLSNRGLDRVVGRLSEIGYDAEWMPIRASDVGANHKRERIWIIAYPKGERLEKRDLYIRSGGPLETSANIDGNSEDVADSGSSRGKEPSRAGRKARNRLGNGCQNLPNAERFNDDDPGYGTSEICRERSEEAEISGRMADPYGSRLEERNGSNATGWSRLAAVIRSWWTTEPDVGRVAYGIPSRVDRLKCLGNSIVPQIAQLIFSQAAFDEWRDK